MKRSLDQLGEVADRLKVPVICAGDIFDRWNSPPELINFAIRNLPDMFAVPGQHDLPLHRLDLVHKSAYDTLVLAGKIKTIPAGGITITDGLSAHGFGWGEEIGEPYGGCGVDIAVVHQFIWVGACGYPGVSEDSHLKQTLKKLKSYDVAVFGDNHKGFLAGKVLNCGTFFRRKSDEIDYRPTIGILYSSGEIVREKLDTTGEYMETTVSPGALPDGDFKVFIDELSRLTSDPLNYTESMKRAIDECPSAGVRSVLEEVLG
jgi:hypothetical protein